MNKEIQIKKWLLSSVSLIIASVIWVSGDDAKSKSSDKPLDEIVVTATRTPKSLKDLSGTITVITSDEIARSSARTADELLMQVPGLNFQGGESLGTNKERLNIRGLGGNYGTQRVLIMQDGRPLNEEYMGDVDLRLISTDNIERIEIVKGPTSALYGSYAMGGVINIITKRGQEKPLLTLTQSVGDFNTQSCLLRYGAKQKQFDYMITASKDSTDGYLLNSDGSKRDWTGEHLTTQFGWTFNLDTSLTLAIGYNDGSGNQSDFIQDIVQDYEDITYQTDWSKEQSAKLLIKVYRNGLNQDLDWKPGKQPATYDQSTLGGQIQQSYKLNETHLLTGGSDIKSEDIDVEERAGNIIKDVNSYALYLQDELTLIGKKTYLTLGLRYDHTSSFGGEVSPRAGLAQHLDAQTILRVSAGKAYRAPAVSDLYLPTTSFMGMTFMGNHDLKPERMWSYEAGIEHQFSFDLWSRLNIYSSNVEDGWDYRQDPDTIYRPSNVAKQLIKGLEAEAKWNIIESLYATGNISYTDSKYERYKSNPSVEGNHTEHIPPQQGSIGLSYQDKENRSVNLQIKEVGARYTDLQNTPAKKLSSYIVVNITTSLPLQKNVRIFTSVNNIFDREYRENLDYLQPGRTFMFGTTISF